MFFQPVEEVEEHLELLQEARDFVWSGLPARPFSRALMRFSPWVKQSTFQLLLASATKLLHPRFQGFWDRKLIGGVDPGSRWKRT
jgi:hypothetical protein